MDPRENPAKATETVVPEVEPLSALLAHPFLQDPIFLTAAIGLIFAVVFLTFLRPRSVVVSRRGGPASILLVGPSDGGKTALFAKLAHETYPQTHTSAIPSSTLFSLPDPTGTSSTSRQVRLIDLPGHPRLRDEVKNHLSEAHAVVFVIDVVGIVRNASIIAEQLTPVIISLGSRSLRDPSLSPTKILLLAHKSDLLIRPAAPSSPSPPNIPDSTRTTAIQRLRSILTREMDRLKSSRGAIGGRIEGMGRVDGLSRGGWWSRLMGGGTTTAEGTEEEDEVVLWGGVGSFKWEDIEGVEVEWGCSGLGMVKVGKDATRVDKIEQGDGLDDVKRFIWDA